MSLPPINASTISASVLPRRLVPRWGKELWTAVVMIGLASFMIWNGLHSREVVHIVSGILLGVAIFVIAGLLLMVLIPGRRYLELTSQGFTVQYGFRSSSYAWREVRDFSVYKQQRRTFVVFNFAGGYVPPTPARRRMSEFARRTFGFDAGLGSDRYEMRPEELAELMNKLRQRYAGAAQ